MLVDEHGPGGELVDAEAFELWVVDQARSADIDEHHRIAVHERAKARPRLPIVGMPHVCAAENLSECADDVVGVARPRDHHGSVAELRNRARTVIDVTVSCELHTEDRRRVHRSVEGTLFDPRFKQL